MGGKSLWLRLPLPGFKSLIGRSIYVVLLFSTLLALAAFFGWHHVNQAATQHIENIQLRAGATDALHDSVQQIRIVENYMQRFIILPNTTNHENLTTALSLNLSTTSRLQSSQWIRQDSSLQELTSALVLDNQRLNQAIEKLIDVRRDEKKWFPALSIMQNQMLQNNLEFNSALELAITEAYDSAQETNNLLSYHLLVDLRYTWLQMISEFRLYISNIFGVFSIQPQSDISARKTNVKVYAERVSKLLQQLIDMSNKGQLELVASKSLVDMRHWQLAWQTAYTQVDKMLNSDIWRADLATLKQDIDPVLARIQQRISSLQLELGVASAKDITQLTELARYLSDMFIILTLGTIALALVGLAFFHHTLLRPIAQVTQALKSEASGHRNVQLPLATTDEIRTLTEAFSKMRLQVHERQAHLDHIAHHDSLTGLPNRSLFRDRLEHSLTLAQREEHFIGLLFLDLDRFKQINDTLGHDIGDRLLQLVAKRITACIRASDTVARLGGDEFAVIAEGLKSVGQVAQLAEKICAAFIEPFQIDEHELYITTSIGIALGPFDDTDTDSLIRDADIAMYHAKDNGRNQYEFYSVKLANKVAERLVMENHLRQALEQNDFQLHFQPIIAMDSGQIIGTEALLRWSRPKHGAVSPVEFIPVLEDTGMIKSVTEWVLLEAGKQFRRFDEVSPDPFRMSVNLSGLLLKRESFLDIVIDAINNTGIDPSGLIVEITEDTLIEDLQAAQVALGTLKQMGIRIALDDFGTRQSSLNHLRGNLIDIVKIDKDFIHDIPADCNDVQLVAAIIAMAHNLGMQVIAEGVETEAQKRFLLEQHCDALQGYLFSRPLPANDIVTLLQQHDSGRKGIDKSIG